MKKIFFVIIFFFQITFSDKSQAQLSPIIDSIPMSDGQKLAADIYIPSGITQGPVILIQTPYNRILYHFSLPLQIGLNLNSSNYIFVIVDWRGFYGSAAAAYAGNPSIGEDGYDVVEWIAQQAWSNGKIGAWGPSALGRVQFQTAKKNPPSLTCICPLVAGPQYDYDEYFPGGVLRTEYVEQLDALGYGISPVLMAHTVHDFVWAFSENANFYPDSILVPCFMIGGWYDHTPEQMLPFFNGIRTQSPINVRDKHRLLMGPWAHGGSGTAQVGSITQGELSYPNAVHWNDSLALLFFDFHLRNINNNWDQTPFVQYYQMGENTWQNSVSWPPTGMTNTNFYFHQNGIINNVAPTNAADALSYNYNPSDPSPTIGGPTLRTDLDQGPYNQTPLVESRNDVLVFSTEVLTQDVVLRGSPVVHLKISSNRKDTDFAVRLTDVYPDGRSMILSDGILRMRFRNGFTANDTAGMIPGTVYDCNITLPNTAITFLAGHKIRVDISSSNYPRFNRNANTNGIMYPGNSLDSLVNPLIANNTVYLNSINFSYITLPQTGFDFVNDEFSNANEVIVYPNPTSDILNVSFMKNVSGIISLCDLQGRIILTQNISGTENSISLSTISAGIYFVKIETEKRVVIRKVVVE